MNAIPMSLLLETLRVLDDCAKTPRYNDDYTDRLALSGAAHSAAFRLRYAMSELAPVAVNRETEAA